MGSSFFALSSQSTVVGDEKLTSREDRIGIPLKKSSIDVFCYLILYIQVIKIPQKLDFLCLIFGVQFNSRVV
nr:MAG TPA: hypothetical protein [Caudoviricetes sp.]